VARIESANMDLRRRPQRMVIRHRDDDVWHEPATSAFPSEHQLQTILRKFPSLLPEAEGEPVVFVPEAFTSPAGYIDLLGVAASESMFLAECKLHTKSEIWRTVLVQILAYGSALRQMSHDDFADLVAGINHGCCRRRNCGAIISFATATWVGLKATAIIFAQGRVTGLFEHVLHRDHPPEGHVPSVTARASEDHAPPAPTSPSAGPAPVTRDWPALVKAVASLAWPIAMIVSVRSLKECIRVRPRALAIRHISPCRGQTNARGRTIYTRKIHTKGH
jgi:hypothetical protein